MSIIMCEHDTCVFRNNDFANNLKAYFVNMIHAYLYYDFDIMIICEHDTFVLINYDFVSIILCKYHKCAFTKYDFVNIITCYDNIVLNILKLLMLTQLTFVHIH